MIEALLDRDLLPEPLVRFGIRRLLASRLDGERRRQEVDPAARLARYRRDLGAAPVAPAPAEANAQHYELPPELFRLLLGPHLKYSSAYWPAGVGDLAAAEEAMLALTAERAGIADGQRILDLGCGWGALSLWLAERFPRAEILAVSNSRAQGERIRAEAARRGLGHVEHRVADINTLSLDERFDRIVSVEMFEHLRNYEALFARLATWLTPGGALFVHVFCHREFTYPYEDRGATDWMARHFFTGGLMPSADLLPAFAGPLRLEERWLVDGTHYARTLEAWLANLEARREELLPVLAGAYGVGQERRWLARWRLFLLACAELFAWRGGREWMVAHYRFAAPGAGGAPAARRATGS